MKLNRAAVQYARSLIRSGRVVKDDRDAWSEHQPSTAEENDFIRRHGFAMYSKWHLGIDEEKDPETKAHYRFPYGDFSKAQPLRDHHGREPRRTVQTLRHREGRRVPAQLDRQDEAPGADSTPFTRARVRAAR